MVREGYSPKPIDISKVTIPKEWESTRLLEVLAKNAHDVWAVAKQTSGWSYGDVADDCLLKSPSLKPYEELSEPLKELDREMVRGTLSAMLALGYRIELDPAKATPPLVSKEINAWVSRLEEESKAAWTEPDESAPHNGERRWTFDMDDAPEISRLPAEGCDRAKEALQYLQDKVSPEWSKADSEAGRIQKRHRFLAAVAIWGGTAGIMLAILQLVMRYLWLEIDDEHAKAAIGKVRKALEHTEMVAIFGAAICVIVGMGFKCHHRWLHARQRAELLRVLKFQALSWRSLWCDFDSWKAEVNKKITGESGLAEVEVVEPELQIRPNCHVDPGSVQVISALYRVKRLSHQRHYFKDKEEKAKTGSKIADWKVGLWIFGLSCLIVAVHSIHHLFHLPPHNRPDLEIAAIGLAALLPVLGFGLRASLAAFETPRSRNLFRAKAQALQMHIDNLKGSNDVQQMMHGIALGEYFLVHEHREWCRLQNEAEWFL